MNLLIEIMVTLIKQISIIYKCNEFTRLIHTYDYIMNIYENYIYLMLEGVDIMSCNWVLLPPRLGTNLDRMHLHID